MMLAKSASLMVYEMMNAKNDKNRANIAKPGDKLVGGTKSVREDFALKLRSDGKVQEAYDRYANLLSIASTMGYKKAINPDIPDADKVLNDFVKAELPDKAVTNRNKENTAALKKKNNQIKK